MVSTRFATIEDLEQMEPDAGDFELIRGELHRMAAAGGRASTIAVGIAAQFWNYATPRGLGTVYGADAGFVLSRDPDTLLIPDVAFVRADRLPPGPVPEGFLPLAPDIAVEVVSPTDRRTDVARKVRLYLDAGVKLVWVVDPRRRLVTVYPVVGSERVLRPGEELDGGEVLPGFRLAVGDLFPA